MILFSSEEILKGKNGSFSQNHNSGFLREESKIKLEGNLNEDRDNQLHPIFRSRDRAFKSNLYESKEVPDEEKFMKLIHQQ